MKLIEKISKTFPDALTVMVMGVLLLVIGVLLLVSLPICLLYSPLSGCKREENENAYRDYLRLQEGGRILVYTSKKKTRDFVERLVLPRLDNDIEIVFLDGKIPRSELEGWFVRRLLNEARDSGGFPWLIKISNGKPVVTSINNIVYNGLRDNSLQKVLSQINSV